MTQDVRPMSTDALVNDGSCPSCQGFYAATDIVAAVPDSFVLYTGPLACMRYSVVGYATPGDRQQAGYLVLTENDIVLGRTEECIVEAVEEAPVTADIPEVGAIALDEEVMDAEESVFEAPEDIEPFVSEEVSDEHYTSLA